MVLFNKKYMSDEVQVVGVMASWKPKGLSDPQVPILGPHDGGS